MNTASAISTGVILITLAGVAYGGSFMLRVVTRREFNALQTSYFRAGHAHAGVLIILGLLIRVILSITPVPTWSSVLASGPLLAAILMPAGFFLSVIGKDPQAPNRVRVLIPIGGVVLAVGVVGAGVGLIVAGASGTLG